MCVSVLMCRGGLLGVVGLCFSMFWGCEDDVRKHTCGVVEVGVMMQPSL